MQEFFDKSMILTGHLFENLQLFHSLKVIYVSSFTIVKRENDPPLQECSNSTWKNEFLLIFKNSNIAAGYKLPVKTKRSKLFTSNNDMQNLSFKN